MHHKKFFKDGTDNIIDTKELIDLWSSATWWNNWKDISDISKSLIIVKSVRALTNAINKNSKKSDTLSIIWLLLTASIFFLWCVELYINTK